jgi:hypothetical protein
MPCLHAATNRTTVFPKPPARRLDVRRRYLQGYYAALLLDLDGKHGGCLARR